MNNIQELIERLRQDAKAMEYNFPAMAERINKAITALESMQAPLPEDVLNLLNEEVISQRTLPEEAIIFSMARMLERLAYENQCHILARKRDKQRIADQQDRNFKLSETLANHIDKTERLDAALEYYCQGDGWYSSEPAETARAGE